MLFKFALLATIASMAFAGALPIVPSLYSANPLDGAPLLPKINVGPTEVTHVKQPVTITQEEPVLRQVPVPVREIAYTAPQVIAPITTAYAAAPIAAPLISSWPSRLLAGGSILL